MVEIPTPKPPIKRNTAKTIGSFDKAEPTAEMVYKTPIQKRVVLRPKRCVGKDPNNAPTTVPQSAIPMTTVP